MRNERRNLILSREHEHHLQMGICYQVRQQMAEKVTGSHIEPDERIVEYQHTGAVHQRLGQLELTQFTTGQKYDVLVQHFFDAEQIVHRLSPSLVLGLGQKFAYQGRHLHVLRIPSLLVVEGTVGIAIRVAEGNVTDMVAHHARIRRREMILHLIHQQRPPPDEDVHQQALSASVGSYQRDVLALLHDKVHGLLHTVRRMTGHAIGYLDDGFHIPIFRIRWHKGNKNLDFLVIIGKIKHLCIL